MSKSLKNKSRLNSGYTFPEQNGANPNGSFDNQTALSTTLSESPSVILSSGTYLVGTGLLSPSSKKIIKGQGRELTFVRTSHSSNAVFSTTAQFCTYEHLSIDRSSSGTGKGIYHVAVNNSSPLEGFSVKNTNVNGHATGVEIKDFVLANFSDCYIQSNVTGFTCSTTGSNANTMLTMDRCWIRGNTTVGASVTSTVNAVFRQVAFETGPLGCSFSACANVSLENCWFESVVSGGEFVNCSTVALRGGQIDGVSTTTRMFYFNGASTPTSVVFDGAWRVANITSQYIATADQGVVIYVRSPELGSYNWQAVNGGKVVFDYDLINSISYDPPSLAANATTTQSITVTGAVAGDMVEAYFDNGTTDNRLLLIQGLVTGPGSVSVLLRNLNTTTLDAASGTLTIKVRKKPLIS